MPRMKTSPPRGVGDKIACGVSMILAQSVWAQQQQGLAVADDAKEPAAEGDAALDEVVVEAQREFFRPTTASSGTKFDLPIFDTPQSITVITEDLLKLLQPQNVFDATRFVAGVHMHSSQTDFVDTGATRMWARGFEIPEREGFKINGFSADGRFAPDPVSVERVEFLKGPSSIIFGVNNYGGTVNTIIKRPQAKPGVEIGLAGGSFDFYRGELDATGPVMSNDAVRYRLTAAVQDQGSVQDGADYKRQSITPSLSFDVSEQLTVNVLGFWQHSEAVPYAYFNVAADEEGNWRIPMELPRETYFGRADRSLVEIDHLQGLVDFTYALESGWKLKGAVGYSKNDESNREIYIYNFDYAADPDVYVYADKDVNNLETYDAEFSFGGDFDAFGRSHTFLMTAEYRRLKVDLPRFPYAILGTVDMFNPDFTPFGSFEFDSLEQNGVQQDQRKHYGISAQALFRMTDDLSVLVGGRFTRTDLKIVDILEDVVVDDPDFVPFDVQADEQVSEFVPRLGIVYSMTDHLNAFFSYSEGFIPLTGITRGLSTISPETGKQYEAGIKGEFRDKRLGAQLSVYRIERENAETDDPENGPGESFAVNGRDQRHQGVEFELFGEVLPNLNAILTYSYLDAEITRNEADGELVGVEPEYIFDTTASIFLNYSFPKNVLPGFSIGASGSYGSDYFQVERLSSRFAIPSQTVWDAYVEYRKPDRYSITLSVENLTDHKGVFSEGCYSACLGFSEPRTVRATVRYKF